MTFISKIIIGGLMSLASLFGYHQPVTQSFGAINPTAGGLYRLQSSISSTQNTVTLTSFKEPVSNIKYTMTYLNSSIEYATIDPQNNTSKEFVSFTGITQNADNTATLTGVTRGLSFSYPYTASTTLQQAHSGQAIFILSNPPQLTNLYGNKSNNESITGLWNFTDPPILTNAATSTLQAASVGYVNGIAFGTGIVPASLGGTGNSSNPLNMILIGNGGSAITSTSSPTVGYITATSTTGTSTFAGSTILASTTITATTSIAASSITNNALKLNGLNYAFPSSRGANGTSLTENGSGSLSWSAVSTPRYTYATTTGMTAASGVYATTTMITIPSGVLTASSTIEVSGTATCTSGASGFIDLRDSVGVTLARMSCNTGGSGDSHISFRFLVVGNNSLSSQTGLTFGEFVNTQATNACGGVACSFVQNAYNSVTSSVNLANAVTFALVAKGTTAATAVASAILIVNP